jgi:hypothetical protein
MTTYSLPFDYAGYKAAIRTASLFVDPRGNPYPATLDTLVCKKGSSVAFKAKEILGAIKKGMIPESFDHDGAGVPAFKIIELDYLTSDVYWFINHIKEKIQMLFGLNFKQCTSLI